MKNSPRWSVALALLVVSAGAMAALGHAPSVPELASVPAGAGSRLAASAPKPYTIHQTVLPTGTVVREFAAPGGNVFALTWQGPVLPDLSAYFGDYFPDFQAMGRQKRDAGMRGGALVARQSNFVVVSRGRMGSFEGHAYAPALVPDGLVIGDLFP